MSGMDRQSRRVEYDSANSNAPIKNRVDELPEFHDYVRMKYGVDIEEDLVTMIEDLIERQKQKVDFADRRIA